MSSSYKEISNIKEIEKGVKNIFRWEWLQENDCNDSFLSDYIRKVDLPGKVVCTICKALISYQSGGKKDVKNHAKKKEHKRLLEIKTSNITIPSSFLSSVSIPVQECNVAYGTPPNVYDA